MTAGPSITVALVTCNGMATLPAVFDALASQELAGGFEIVAVDSASSDGSQEFLASRVDRLLRIKRQDFNHGLTRNLAIENASGDLVVLLVQDAVPASASWLGELTAGFADQPELAGTFARQLARPQASQLTRVSLEGWVAAQDKAYTSAIPDPAAWQEMAPMERFLASVFDNVCSCLRRSVWHQHRFCRTAIAEDLEWGKEVLLAGHQLAYVPTAAVVHSHERGMRYELGRTYLVHRRLHELFGVRTIPTARLLFRSFSVTLGNHLRCLRGPGRGRPGPGEILRTLGLAFVWPLGQYLGGRAAVRGKAILSPRGI